MKTGGGGEEDVELVPDALDITPERPDLRRRGEGRRGWTWHPRGLQEGQKGGLRLAVEEEHKKLVVGVREAQAGGQRVGWREQPKGEQKATAMLLFCNFN